MSRFIALPVGQGDAFYLERKDFRVLIDGGKSKTAIAPWMNEICKTNHLDVLVCTHNDSDHANGIVGLLENWSGSINEVWLPGSWTYRMKVLLEEPYEFCSELVHNIFDIGVVESPNISLSLETIAASQNIRFEQSDDSTFDIEDAVDVSGEFPKNLMSFCAGNSGYALFWFQEYLKKYPNSYLFSLFEEAINAASNIRKIAALTYHRGCKIRFFEYGRTVSGGLPQKLVPLNSKEIVSLRSVKISALEFLALTTANKESLVFYSPEDEINPAVLFTADSDLRCSLPASTVRCPIVTSPHHGADANANAYTVVSAWLNNRITPIWVRSDCKSKARPGNAFKKEITKICTLCNCGEHPKQTVKLHSRLGHWQVTTGTRRCSCR